MTIHRAAEVFPPGEFIKDEIEARGWSQADLAEILGRPIQAVNEIIAGKKSITPETARELGDAFGTGASLWLNLEAAYRLSAVSTDDRAVARRARLFGKAPIRELVRRNWIEDSSNLDDLEASLISFFDLPSIDHSPSFTFAAKKQHYDSTSVSQIAWCYRAKKMAETQDVRAFDEVGLSDAIKRLRVLSGSVEGIRSVPNVLADLGVRFVIVEHLKSTKIDGAAFWLDERSPVIAMSMRYDRIDNFWFVLGHELAHIKNADKSVDAELVGANAQPTKDKPAFERKADEMAATFLISSKVMSEFILRQGPKYSKVAIERFSKAVGVHPGIVVGQLQHRGEIGYSHSREMLCPVRSLITKAALTDGWCET